MHPRFYERLYRNIAMDTAGGAGGAGGGAGGSGSSAGGGGAGKSQAELLAELAASNLEIKRLTDANNGLTTQVTTLTAKNTTDVTAAVDAEKAKGGKLRTKIVNAELRAQAAENGLVDTDLLGHAFFDTAKITVDDDGNVAGVKEMFAEVKTKKPDWFKPAAGAGGAGGAGGAAGGGAAGGGATGGGSPPPGNNGSGTGNPTNVKTLKPEEYRDHKANFLKNLRKTA